MAGVYIPVVVGDVEILVEATPVRLPGDEPTGGGLGNLSERVRDAFGQAQSAIVEIATSTATALGQAGRAVRPDTMEVEFGVKFSAKGDIIVAGASGEMTLKVKLTYEGRGAESARADEGDEGDDGDDGDGDDHGDDGDDGEAGDRAA
ncbi:MULTISPECIES: CU044_2847 family protein [unclassified Streptomyces]|uniref:CU044_2847 family protein n=1 Tax=unclassified Streptomyces TaxID=2593676 RepID=UPI0036AF2C4C